jgi:hypothetical protein
VVACSRKAILPGRLSRPEPFALAFDKHRQFTYHLIVGKNDKTTRSAHQFVPSDVELNHSPVLLGVSIVAVLRWGES